MFHHNNSNWKLCDGNAFMGIEYKLMYTFGPCHLHQFAVTSHIHEHNDTHRYKCVLSSCFERSFHCPIEKWLLCHFIGRFFFLLLLAVILPLSKRSMNFNWQFLTKCLLSLLFIFWKVDHDSRKIVQCQEEPWPMCKAENKCWHKSRNRDKWKERKKKQKLCGNAYRKMCVFVICIIPFQWVAVLEYNCASPYGQKAPFTWCVHFIWKQLEFRQMKWNQNKNKTA